MTSIKKGSGVYRKAISRGRPPSDIHNPTKWNKRLNTTLVTRTQVKKCLINLHSRYLDSASADHLSRLKLCKTLFNSQLFAMGVRDDKSCSSCIREFNIYTDEDYKHAMFYCPLVQAAIDEITITFFPQIITNFDITEVLTSVTKDKHYLYQGQDGQKLASTIWDLLQVYIIKCHNKDTTPIPATAIFEIRTQLNQVLKILPRSRLSLFIKKSKRLLEIIGLNGGIT